MKALRVVLFRPRRNGYVQMRLTASQTARDEGNNANSTQERYLERTERDAKDGDGDGDSLWATELEGGEGDSGV